MSNESEISHVSWILQMIEYFEEFFLLNPTRSNGFYKASIKANKGADFPLVFPCYQYTCSLSVTLLKPVNIAW